MATNSELAVGPAAMTDGYSMNGSQANSVALNPGGSLRGGKRLSVSAPVSGLFLPSPANAPMRTTVQSARRKRCDVTASNAGVQVGRVGQTRGERRAGGRAYNTPAETLHQSADTRLRPDYLRAGAGSG